MAAAFCGFAMGATATAIANMQALARRHGPAPQAFLIARHDGVRVTEGIALLRCWFSPPRNLIHVLADVGQAVIFERGISESVEEPVLLPLLNTR
jgi:hypothetical protein